MHSNNASESSSSDAQTAKANKAIVEQGYDIIAPKYLAWSAPRPTTTRMAYLDKLLTILQPGSAILELGCGAGVPCTQKLIASGMKVTGVDISSSQIALAREHIPQATLIRSDMMSLDDNSFRQQQQQRQQQHPSFDNFEFDAVVAFYSIFHLPRDEQGSMIRKMGGWIREGGILLFNLNTNEGDHYRDDWMGARMFSSGLGIEKNREMLRVFGQGLVVEDEVVGEIVGGVEEKFHWVWATKKEP